MASSYMSGALSVRRLTNDRHYQKYVTPEKTTDFTYYQVKLPTCICCRDYPFHGIVGSPQFRGYSMQLLTGMQFVLEQNSCIKMRCSSLRGFELCKRQKLGRDLGTRLRFHCIIEYE